MANARSLGELLQSYRSNKSTAETAKTAANTDLTELRNRLIAGEATDNRAADMALIFECDFDPEKGKKYTDLEARFQAHPGGVFLLQVSWEEDLVRYCMPPIGGHGGMTHTAHAYILGIVSLEPKLSWSERGGLELPIHRAVAVELNNPKITSTVQEFARGSTAPGALHHELLWGLAKIPGEGGLIIGTEEVLNVLSGGGEMSLWRLQGEEAKKLWISNHFAALGLESFDIEGQGRLGIPDKVQVVG